MLTGVHNVDQATLLRLYKNAIKTKANIMVFGPAGSGKTEMAQEASNVLDREHIYLNGSTLEAPDMIGLPMIDIDTKTTDYANPKFLPLEGARERKCVLLVDEVDKLKPELQNPMLEIFQFRSINGRKLAIDSVIATGNLPDEGAFSLPVSQALTNRCQVYRVDVAFEPWRNWAVNTGVNALVVGFLNKNPEFLLRKPPEGDDTAYCHESPRSWTQAGRDLDNSEEKDVNFQTMIVAGRVGTGGATKFNVWLEHYRHIEPIIDALIKQGKHPQNLTIDRVLVCAIAGCSKINQMGIETVDASKRAEHEKKCHIITKNVFGWVQTLGSEFIIGAVKSALSQATIEKMHLTRVPEFMAAFDKIRSMLKGFGY